MYKRFLELLSGLLQARTRYDSPSDSKRGKPRPADEAKLNAQQMRQRQSNGQPTQPEESPVDLQSQTPEPAGPHAFDVGKASPEALTSNQQHHRLHVFFLP